MSNNKVLSYPEQKIIHIQENPLNSNAVENRQNGDYSVNLKKRIALHEGDELNIKSAYVSLSSENTGQIFVDSDFGRQGGVDDLRDKCTVSMKFGYYVMDYYNEFPAPQANGLPTESKDYLINTGTTSTSGDPFVAMVSTDVDINDNVGFDVSEFEIPIEDITGSYDFDDTFSLNISYTVTAGNFGDTNRITQVLCVTYEPAPILHSPLKATKITDSPFYKFDSVIKKHVLVVNQDLINNYRNQDSGKGPKNAFSFGSDNKILMYNQDIVATEGNGGDAQPMVRNPTDVLNIISVATSINISAPFLTTLSIQIDAPKFYDPSELAQVISSGFETMIPSTSADVNELTSNQLLTNTAVLVTKTTPGNQPNDKVQFVNLATNQQFEFKDNMPSYNIGASQFGLTYDPTSTMFEISQMHTSRYDTGGNTIVSGFINPAGSKKFLDRYSGIFIQELAPNQIWLTNSDNTQKPNSMNFDQSILTTLKHVKTNIGTPDPNNPSVVDAFTIPAELKVGVNVTSDFGSIDSLVLKSKDVAGSKHYDTAFQFALFPTFDDIVTQTNGIYSHATVDPQKQGNLQGGYYMVELDLGTANDFNSHAIHNNKIKGVVSKYYVNANVISAGEESGFTYIHKGEPIDISKINVRILNSKGQLATDIGNDSSIFLQLNTKK